MENQKTSSETKRKVVKGVRGVVLVIALIPIFGLFAAGLLFVRTGVTAGDMGTLIGGVVLFGAGAGILTLAFRKRPKTLLSVFLVLLVLAGLTTFSGSVSSPGSSSLNTLQTWTLKLNAQKSVSYVTFAAGTTVNFNWKSSLQPVVVTIADDNNPNGYHYQSQPSLTGTAQFTASSDTYYINWAVGNQLYTQNVVTFNFSQPYTVVSG